MRIVIIAVIIVVGCVGLLAEPNVEEAVINSDALHLVDVMTAEYKERLVKMLSDMPAEKQLQWIKQTKRSRENRQRYKADYELLNSDEAMKFVSSCLLKIKHKDKSVLKVFD